MTDQDRQDLRRRIASIDARAAAGQPWADDTTSRAHYAAELEHDAHRRARLAAATEPRRTKWDTWRLMGAWLTGVAVAGPAPRGLVAAALTRLGKGLVVGNPVICKAALRRLVALADLPATTRWKLTPQGTAALEARP